MKKRPPAPARALLTLLPQQTTKLLQLIPDFYFTRKNPFFFFQPSSYCQGGLNFLPGSFPLPPTLLSRSLSVSRSSLLEDSKQSAHPP